MKMEHIAMYVNNLERAKDFLHIISMQRQGKSTITKQR